MSLQNSGVNIDDFSIRAIIEQLFTGFAQVKGNYLSCSSATGFASNARSGK